MCACLCGWTKKEGDEGISPFAQTPLCVSGENTLWLEQKKLLSIYNATYEPVCVWCLWRIGEKIILLDFLSFVYWREITTDRKNQAQKTNEDKWCFRNRSGERKWAVRVWGAKKKKNASKNSKLNEYGQFNGDRRQNVRVRCDSGQHYFDWMLFFLVSMMLTLRLSQATSSR